MPTYLPLVYADSQHKPMQSSDLVDPRVVAVSARSDNQIQKLTDGLYLGDNIGVSVLYVADAGTDDEAAGTAKETPFKTLDYALQRIASMSLGGVFKGRVILALKAGETFSFANDFSNAGDLTLTFFDSTFGDYDALPIGTGAYAANIAELDRPVINVSSTAVSSLWKSYGIRNSGNAKLTLLGVHVNLPEKPVSNPDIEDYTGLSDFITAYNHCNLTVSLEGSVINLGVASVFGLLGMFARASDVRLDQFGTQFLVGGVKADASAPVANLESRQYFIKFYSDYAGNNQQAVILASTSANASSGTAILKLNWTETQRLTIDTDVNSMDSYPALANSSYGLRNYFYGLVRDQQARPLNVVSGRLF